MTTLELTVVVDCNGDYGVGKDEAAAIENYETDVQPIGDSGGYRVYKMDLSVPLPEAVSINATIAEPIGGPVALTLSK